VAAKLQSDILETQAVERAQPRLRGRPRAALSHEAGAPPTAETRTRLRSRDAHASPPGLNSYADEIEGAQAAAVPHVDRYLIATPETSANPDGKIMATVTSLGETKARL
jgi:hypothetical protein